MTRPQVVLFDIGSTLWRSPPEHPDALSYCYGRAHQIVEKALGTAPEVEQLTETVEGYLAEWEDIWRTDQTKIQQPPTTLYVAQALERIGVVLPEDALRQFTDIAMQVSVFTAKTEPPEPGMREALAELRGLGLRLGCVSNAFMSALTLHRIMEERGFGAYLDLTVSSCDLGWRKPDAKIYQAALDKMHTTAPETIFVGDRLDADVEGPARLGMLTVLSHQYRQEDPAIARVKPDFVITHLSELPEYVASLLRSAR